MDTLAALMLLVGCNADLSSCTEVPVPSPVYASASACERALPMEMRFAATGDRRMIGSCTAVDEAALERAASVEWAVNRAGRLAVALVEDDTSRVASR